MSADNYLYVTRLPGQNRPIEVFHLFASDEEVDLSAERPLFMTSLGAERALRWAYDWARENVCEYGVKVDDSIWEAQTTDTKGQP